MISRNNIKWVRQLEMKKYRKQEGMFVAEGPKVVGDLLRAGFAPHSVYATTAGIEALGPLLATADQTIIGSGNTESAIARGGTVCTVSDDELRKISFLQHPQQVMAVFPIPKASACPSADNMPTGLALALDGVQDPGNVGTIIRLADWFGISTIFCSPDTADAYNPKVVQATMGSIARVRIIYTEQTSLLATLPNDYPVYGTLLDGDNIYQQQLSAHGLIVMGNEGNGISQAVRRYINRKLFIPRFSTGRTVAESLNVAIATAITCSEFRRRGESR
ncbi:MAG: RNA methyltransferase [Prevotella sp.]|nr:RNA methyltransferase [Prevotella sp.]